MKKNHYIIKLSWINIIKKKKRTLLSIFSILLSTAIIYTSLILFLNIALFSNKADMFEKGNYHYAISQINPIELSSRYLVTKDSDTGYYGEYNGNLINLRVLDFNDSEPLVLPFSLVEGRLPKNKNEVLISSKLSKQMNDNIVLDFDSELLSLNVVGIYEGDETLDENMIYLYTQNESTNACVYYIKDSEVHLSSSISTLADKTNVEIEDIVVNEEVITADTMKNYMQDTTLLLIIFVLIMVIAILMSLISLYNVILVNDASRKKELGILKSVGASPKQIRQLLQVELLSLGMIGAFLGLCIGVMISYSILNSFIDQIYVGMDKSMYLNPWVMAIAFTLGVLLMYLSGMKAYKKYIYSQPVEDLKEVSLVFAKPSNNRYRKKNAASWELFLIYNERMKAQTKNIRISFILLLVAMVLFSSIALSNAVYKNTYHDVNYDFLIQNKTTDFEGWTDLNFDFAYLLYDEKEKGTYGVESVYANRRGLTGFLTQPSLYQEDMFQEHIQYYQQELKLKKDMLNTEWCDLYFTDTILDQRQWEFLENYASQLKDDDYFGLKGQMDQDYLMIVSDIWIPIHMYLNVGKKLEEGSNVYIGTYSLKDGFDISNRDIEAENKQVKGVIFMNVNEQMEVTDLYFPLDNTQQILARRGNDNTTQDFYGVESFEIKLKNTIFASEFQERLDEIIIETNSQDMYQYINVASTIETMKYATFLIEVLLYPLFLMLFIISLLNLLNVFLGNIHIKRGDIMIFKLLGIKNRQVYKIFMYEYLEGYLNAAAIISALFVLMTFVEQQIGYISALKLGENVLGTLICSIFVMGPMFILPMALLTISQIKFINANDDSRNIE